MTIQDAWFDGLSVADASRSPIILGLGRKTVPGECENRANNVTFQNAKSWTKFTYGYNEPITSNLHLCGYYQYEL
jgi:hypothetical protein